MWCMLGRWRSKRYAEDAKFSQRRRGRNRMGETGVVSKYVNQFEIDVQTDFSNPGSEKSGEYLQAQIEKRVSIYISQGQGVQVVDVLRKWILQREHLAMIAITIAKTHSFSVLIPEIDQLNNDVLAGKVFHTYYSAEWIAPALESLKSD